MAELALWTAKSGIDVQQRNLEVISQNLANVNTTGYKRARMQVETLPYQTLRQAGAQENQQDKIPTGLQIGTGAKVVATQKIFTQGSQQRTGNQLDIAINGDGFFQITQVNGEVAYTRDGSFTLNDQGEIVNSHGERLFPALTIPAGTTGITISTDGIVSAITSTSPVPTQVGQIEMATFINPAGLSAIGDNKYVRTAASGDPQTGNPGDGATGLGTTIQAALETSNVNMVEELVNLIEAQRAYEINGKGLEGVNHSLQTLTQQLS